MAGVDEEYDKAAEAEVVATAPSETVDGLGVQTVYVDSSADPPAIKPPLPPALLALVALAALVGAALFGVVRAKSSSAPVAFQDLGAGISNATGLRGNLKARWQNKTAQYELSIEPIDPLQSAGFSFVTANPPSPLFIHVKLLDATGFALCGKDILFPFSGPGEPDRERGQDVFQNSIGDDGKVTAVTAQGTFPCSPQQYKQIVYWDLSTNFPTLAEQDDLMKNPAQTKAQQQSRATSLRRKRPRSDFYTEGDDRVIGYDAQRKLLETGLRSFLVSGSAGQSTANLWASDSVLFHYKCDQHSRCVLTHAGGMDSLTVFAQQ